MQPGDIVEDFTLPNQDGVPVSLSSLAASPVVLFFYPRADTPGCTIQLNFPNRSTTPAVAVRTVYRVLATNTSTTTASIQKATNPKVRSIPRIPSANPIRPSIHHSSPFATPPRADIKGMSFLL